MAELDPAGPAASLDAVLGEALTEIDWLVDARLAGGELTRRRERIKTRVEHARLIDWVREARGMPWEGDVVATAARALGVSTQAVRAEAYEEDESGWPLPAADREGTTPT